MITAIKNSTLCCSTTTTTTNPPFPYPPPPISTLAVGASVAAAVAPVYRSYDLLSFYLWEVVAG